MENLRPGPQVLSLEQEDSVNMTVSAEVARLKADGIVTHGDKYAFIYDVFGGPIEKDKNPDQARQKREKDERTRRIRRMFGVSDEEISGIFRGDASEELKEKVDKVAVFASIVFRIEKGDYSKTLNTLTTKFPILKKGYGDRTFEDCIRQGEIDWILLNYEQLLTYSHDEL